MAIDNSNFSNEFLGLKNEGSEATLDALLDDILVAMLRQLRDGYQSRPKHFPSSIVLVGLRDIRDYRAQVKEGRKSMGSASPFNIKSDSLVLNDFTKEEVCELLDQHTRATGQEFPIEAKEEIYRLANGQPWLTNALARQIVEKILKNDYSQKITLEIVTEAKKELILRRDTHLDCLIDKLNEDKVKKIVQAIIKVLFTCQANFYLTLFMEELAGIKEINNRRLNIRQVFDPLP